jgi:hypothetical protein
LLVATCKRVTTALHEASFLLCSCVFAKPKKMVACHIGAVCVVLLSQAVLY